MQAVGGAALALVRGRRRHGGRRLGCGGPQGAEGLAFVAGRRARLWRALARLRRTVCRGVGSHCWQGRERRDRRAGSGQRLLGRIACCSRRHGDRIGRRPSSQPPAAPLGERAARNRGGPAAAGLRHPAPLHAAAGGERLRRGGPLPLRGPAGGLRGRVGQRHDGHAAAAPAARRRLRPRAALAPALLAQDARGAIRAEAARGPPQAAARGGQHVAAARLRRLRHSQAPLALPLVAPTCRVLRGMLRLR
mmetsp:Transcript_98855/g.262500  ORF Transcript_98855/g.262500 Transcript_98855/m.262500 type:complete len:249 (+) Transcript_98855:899-1645(+)